MRDMELNVGHKARREAGALRAYVDEVDLNEDGWSAIIFLFQPWHALLGLAYLLAPSRTFSIPDVPTNLSSFSSTTFIQIKPFFNAINKSLAR